eukprot:tig00020564_g11405.t1
MGAETSRQSLLDAHGDDLHAIHSSEISLGRKLGHGVSGDVYEAQWQRRSVAVKIAKASLSEAFLKEFRAEASLLRQACTLRHPNIIMFYGLCAEPGQLMIITELASEGSLDTYLKRVKCDLVRKSQILFDVACGMNYLVTRRPRQVLHCDLKLTNVLLTGDGTAKLADFGLASLRRAEAGLAAAVEGVVGLEGGTPAYMAPELFNRGTPSEKSDCFSFGVLAWEVLTEQEAWIGYDMETIARLITARQRPPVPPNLDPTLAALIRRCWAEDPNARPAFEEVLDILEPYTGRQSPRGSLEGPLPRRSSLGGAGGGGAMNGDGSQRQLAQQQQQQQQQRLSGAQQQQQQEQQQRAPDIGPGSARGFPDRPQYPSRPPLKDAMNPYVSLNYGANVPPRQPPQHQYPYRPEPANDGPADGGSYRSFAAALAAGQPPPLPGNQHQQQPPPPPPPPPPAPLASQAPQGPYRPAGSLTPRGTFSQPSPRLGPSGSFTSPRTPYIAPPPPPAVLSTPPGPAPGGDLAPSVPPSPRGSLSAQHSASGPQQQQRGPSAAALAAASAAAAAASKSEKPSLFARFLSGIASDPSPPPPPSHHPPIEPGPLVSPGYIMRQAQAARSSPGPSSAAPAGPNGVGTPADPSGGMYRPVRVQSTGPFRPSLPAQFAATPPKPGSVPDALTLAGGYRGSVELDTAPRGIQGPLRPSKSFSYAMGRSAGPAQPQPPLQHLAPLGGAFRPQQPQPPQPQPPLPSYQQQQQQQQPPLQQPPPSPHYSPMPSGPGYSPASGALMSPPAPPPLKPVATVPVPAAPPVPMPGASSSGFASAMNFASTGSRPGYPPAGSPTGGYSSSLQTIVEQPAAPKPYNFYTAPTASSALRSAYPAPQARPPYPPSNVTTPALSRANSISSAAGGSLSSGAPAGFRVQLPIPPPLPPTSHDEAARLLSRYSIDLRALRGSADLSRRQLRDSGVTELARALPLSPELRALSLSANAFTEHGSRALSGALLASSLTALDLSGNPLGAPGARWIAAALGRGAPLALLNLSDCGIDSEGAEYIGLALGSSQAIRELHLAGNPIRERGARFIAEGLQTNRTLARLNLRLCKTKLEGKSKPNSSSSDSFL